MAIGHQYKVPPMHTYIKPISSLLDERASYSFKVDLSRHRSGAPKVLTRQHGPGGHVFPKNFVIMVFKRTPFLHSINEFLGKDYSFLPNVNLQSSGGDSSDPSDPFPGYRPPLSFPKSLKRTIWNKALLKAWNKLGQLRTR